MTLKEIIDALQKEGLTMEQIAAKSSISERTLYRYKQDGTAKNEALAIMVLKNLLRDLLNSKATN